MGTTPTDSHHVPFNQSRSTNLIEISCTSISESLIDVGLPQELITEILLRLPVKPLSKFKCVSKSWLSLISSNQFVKSHFSAFSRADPCLNSQVLFSTLAPISAIKQFTLSSALCEPSTHVCDIEYPSPKPGQYHSIAGIVNGLICLIIGNGLFLWNPVLRNSKRLPKPNVTLKSYPFESYGFGYDESNDDYKVVFAASKYPFQSDRVTEGRVYSLLTDSWRRIEDFKGWLPLDGSGKYANGKIHWTASSSAREWKIVSLDMVSEKYGELQQPDYEAGLSGRVLGVLGGRLFVFCDYDRLKADLWVMEDKYGVEESWSKVVSVPYDNVHPAKPYSWHRVVCLLRNGEIVLSDGSDLLVYHSKRNEFRNVELGGCKHCSFHVYVESLVSPNGSSL